MSLKDVLQTAAKLYDEDSDARDDREWAEEAAEALMDLVRELRSEPTTAGILMIKPEWVKRTETK